MEVFPSNRRSIVRRLSQDASGVALAVVIMMLAILLALTGGAVLLSGLNLKMTAGQRLGIKSLQVADAGLRHAVSGLPWGTSFDYGSQTALLNNVSFGDGYAYTVTAINDPDSAGGDSRAILTAAGLGPSSSKRVVLAYVERGWGGSPGAVYLPGEASNIETNFSGTSFIINGNDTNVNGTPGPQSAREGIATTDPALVTEITNDTLTDGGLSENQMPYVTGEGGAPSVGAVTPFSQTVSQVADEFLTHPHTALPGGTYSGNATWGTDAAPQITRITGNARISGTIEGTGVLIVDGTLDISGNITFRGLIIARGDIEVQITGNASIYGSVMIAESSGQDSGYELDVRGNAHLYYSSQALSWVNTAWPNALPQPAKLIAWREMM